MAQATDEKNSSMHVAAFEFERDWTVNCVLCLIPVLLREPLREQFQSRLYLQLAMAEHVLGPPLDLAFSIDLSRDPIDRCVRDFQRFMRYRVRSYFSRAREACGELGMGLQPVIHSAPRGRTLLTAKLTQWLALRDPLANGICHLFRIATMGTHGLAKRSGGATRVPGAHEVLAVIDVREA